MRGIKEIDVDDLIEHIEHHTDLNKKTIEEVLKWEEDYLEAEGLIEKEE